MAVAYLVSSGLIGIGYYLATEVADSPDASAFCVLLIMVGLFTAIIAVEATLDLAREYEFI